MLFVHIWFSSLDLVHMYLAAALDCTLNRVFRLLIPSTWSLGIL